MADTEASSTTSLIGPNPPPTQGPCKFFCFNNMPHSFCEDIIVRVTISDILPPREVEAHCDSHQLELAASQIQVSPQMAPPSLAAATHMHLSSASTGKHLIVSPIVSFIGLFSDGSSYLAVMFVLFRWVN